MTANWQTALRTHWAKNPVAVAFAISILAHLLLLGAWEGGQRLGLFDSRASLFSKAVAVPLNPVELAKRQAEELENQAMREIPLTFVDVDPSHAVTEAPANAKYYSSASTQAANPDPADKDLENPRVEGRETPVIKTTQPRSVAVPLQPAFAQPEEETTSVEEPNPAPLEVPKSGEKAGELSMAKAGLIESPLRGQSEKNNPQTERKQRPRTLAQARQNTPSNQLRGEQSKIDGGVRRPGATRLDVKGSPFGAYDAAFIDAVEQRWNALLNEMNYSFEQRGTVVVKFNLKSDGSILGMTVVQENTGPVLSLICQRAIRDPAPYAKWPGDMRRMIGSDLREITFTFYYY